MGHGLGAQKDFGLWPYAQNFTRAGMAVLAVDYRGFGGSEGAPRNHIDPRAHVEDLVSTLRYVRSTGLGGRVDTGRVALWGTSMAGGHVLVAASSLLPGDVRCVISQAPHLDGAAASARNVKERGAWGTAQAITLGVADLLRGWMGLEPIYVKIAGLKEELAYMRLSAPELEHYFAKHPPLLLGGWENAAPARTMVKLATYSPIRSVAQVGVPVLYLAATSDELCPVEAVRRAVAETPKAELVELAASHFDMYLGETRQRAVAEMVAFLRKHL